MLKPEDMIETCLEGDEPVVMTWGQFVDENPDLWDGGGDTGHEIESAVAHGLTYYGGGGAAPRFSVRRAE